MLHTHQEEGLLLSVRVHSFLKRKWGGMEELREEVREFVKIKWFIQDRDRLLLSDAFLLGSQHSRSANKKRDGFGSRSRFEVLEKVPAGLVVA